jgi:hypothetical protein
MAARSCVTLTASRRRFGERGSALFGFGHVSKTEQPLICSLCAWTGSTVVRAFDRSTIRVATRSVAARAEGKIDKVPWRAARAAQEVHA